MSSFRKSINMLTNPVLVGSYNMTISSDAFRKRISENLSLNTIEHARKLDKDYHCWQLFVERKKFQITSLLMSAGRN